MGFKRKERTTKQPDFIFFLLVFTGQQVKGESTIIILLYNSDHLTNIPILYSQWYTNNLQKFIFVSKQSILVMLTCMSDESSVLNFFQTRTTTSQFRILSLQKCLVVTRILRRRLVEDAKSYPPKGKLCKLCMFTSICFKGSFTNSHCFEM